MRRTVLKAADLIQTGLSRSHTRFRAAMFTLTYRDCVPWEPRHISEFVKHAREYLGRRGVPVRFLWVMELTKRGRPHYHVLFWLPRGVTLPKPDNAGWWVHGMTRSEWARKPVGYLAKYASKGLEGWGGHELPKGARLYGYCGLTGNAQRELRYYLAPRWLKDLIGYDVVDVRKVDGWWEVPAFGTAYQSPWAFEGIVNGVVSLAWRGVAKVALEVPARAPEPVAWSPLCGRYKLGWRPHKDPAYAAAFPRQGVLL